MLYHLQVWDGAPSKFFAPTRMVILFRSNFYCSWYTYAIEGRKVVIFNKYDGTATWFDAPESDTQIYSHWYRDSKVLSRLLVFSQIFRGWKAPRSQWSSSKSWTRNCRYNFTGKFNILLIYVYIYSGNYIISQGVVHVPSYDCGNLS